MIIMNILSFLRGRVLLESVFTIFFGFSFDGGCVQAICLFLLTDTCSHAFHITLSFQLVFLRRQCYAQIFARPWVSQERFKMCNQNKGNLLRSNVRQDSQALSHLSWSSRSGRCTAANVASTIRAFPELAAHSAISVHRSPSIGLRGVVHSIFRLVHRIFSLLHLKTLLRGSFVPCVGLSASPLVTLPSIMSVCAASTPHRILLFAPVR